MFENLKKCVCYVLSSNVPQMVPFLVFIAAKMPLAIETICILLIDLGTDLAPAVAIAYEEPEAMIMAIPPRKRTDHLVGLKICASRTNTTNNFTSRKKAGTAKPILRVSAIWCSLRHRAHICWPLSGDRLEMLSFARLRWRVRFREASMAGWAGVCSRTIQ